MNNQLRKLLIVTLSFLLFACGGGSDAPPPPLQASVSKLVMLEQVNGITPFIKNLRIGIDNYADLHSISYTILPKEGTFSKPVSVQYLKTYLDQRAFYNASNKQVLLPIFGLYAAYQNKLILTSIFNDGSSKIEQIDMLTTAFDDPTKVYSAIDIKQARGADSQVGFDFVAIKSGLTTPVIIDTDGNLRWVGNGIVNSATSVFLGNSFFVGSQIATNFYKLEFDGSHSSILLPSNLYTNFHHNLAPGKVGMLAEFDAKLNGVKIIESLLVEINEKGEILKEWDMGAILKDVMQKGGDDPTNFIRDGIDWFHMNSAIYNRADNSLLISSRENFVMKIDYETGKLKWLLGDTSKHWYVDYPSLQAYSLTLTEGKAPIGQHALSITSDGNLMLFNNGFASLNQPAGSSVGVNRTFSAASRYLIDETAKTAKEIWTFENEQKIYSDICSSVYEGSANTYLINYSVAYNRTKAKLIGVDAAGKITFDFEYPNAGCNTSWNAYPIAFENMIFK